MHDFSETINAMVDGRRDWRRLAVKTPDVAKAWRRLYPATCHIPSPLPALLAMQTAAMRRGGVLFTAALGLGFLGLFRPSELLGLAMEDIQRLSPPRKLREWYCTRSYGFSWGDIQDHFRRKAIAIVGLFCNSRSLLRYSRSLLLYSKASAEAAQITRRGVGEGNAKDSE